ncbi:S1 RNA-binding domain-containing protein [Mycoplasma struthionis]|uniref:S1 RNA-binding domain-containing protein n=1 Tax=Mycoplasma struthionis TaxID=538220 RepID=UPI002FE06BAA
MSWFLRIHNSNNFYDKTNIHPESYKLADSIVKLLKLDLSNIDKDKILNADKEVIIDKLKISEYDLDLILDSLLKPGKDIREDKKGFEFSDKILEIDDLAIGQELKGEIQNVTDFGAFAFIGLKQAVLIHIRNMKKTENQYIKHPLEVLKVGDNVNIKIIDIDKKRGRIQGKIIWN